MNKAEYERLAEELILPIAEENSFELVDVEFVKEGSDYYLRAYIDKEGGITVNDCEIVSRRVDPLLDEKDFIKESYIFEVSSPGLTRPLKKEKDFARSIGRLVEVKTFKAVNGAKEFEGELKAYTDDTLTVLVSESEIVFERSNISLVRLAFVE